MDEKQEMTAKILENVGKVIIGKKEVSKFILTAMLANGHVLLEDVPGTGKTVMAKTFAKSIEAGFNRIQFTPDLLPSDVTGIIIRSRKNLYSGRDLYLLIFYLLMRLTGQHQGHSRHCLNVWRNIRLQ